MRGLILETHPTDAETKDDTPQDLADVRPAAAALQSEPSRSSEAVGNLPDDGARSDDPFRLYMNEAGGHDLLTREGEVILAQRMEAGAFAVLVALACCPRTYDHLAKWRLSLIDGHIPLRRLIDIPGVELSTLTAGIANDVIAAAGLLAEREQMRSLGSADFRKTESNRESMLVDPSDADQDEHDAATVLAKERKLLPAAIARLDRLAGIGADLAPLFEDQRRAASERLRPEDRVSCEIDRLTELAAQELSALRLQPARVSSLSEEIWAANKTLGQAERDLLRVARSCGLSHETFLASCRDRTFGPRSAGAPASDPAGPLARLFETHGRKLDDLRRSIQRTEEALRLPVETLREIAGRLRCGERDASDALNQMVAATFGSLSRLPVPTPTGLAYHCRILSKRATLA